MTQAPQAIDIFLQPGEFYFGEAGARVRTLLGSCVAITLGHPRLRLGGMCHYMLPSRSGARHGTELDGRYADEAMFMFLREIRHVGTQVREYEVKMFGGGNMFPNHARRGGDCVDVSCRNVQAGRHLLKTHGLMLKAEHVGGHGHRQVVLDLDNGDVWMRQVVLGAEQRCLTESLK